MQYDAPFLIFVGILLEVIEVTPIIPEAILRRQLA